MENTKFVFKVTQVGYNYLESDPEGDLGFSYEEAPDYEIVDDTYYEGLVKIDILIDSLKKLKEMGANYVSIDFNEDHQDYKVEGYEFRHATQEEKDQWESKLLSEETRKKEQLIEQYKQKIKELEK